MGDGPHAAAAQSVCAQVDQRAYRPSNWRRSPPLQSTRRTAAPLPSRLYGKTGIHFPDETGMRDGFARTPAPHILELTADLACQRSKRCKPPATQREEPAV